MLENGTDLQGTYDMFRPDTDPELAFGGLQDPCAAIALSLSAENNLMLEEAPPGYPDAPPAYLAFRRTSS